MNPVKVAAALNTLSLGIAELAEALTEANGHIPVSAPTTAPGPSGALVEPEFPPFAPEEPVYEAIPLPADAPGLGRCPNHGTAWTVKPGGYSDRTKKNYDAFWKCEGKDSDGTYCSKKPTKAWADAHPLT